jgi:choice-of-anchor B domain-containing protein
MGATVGNDIWGWADPAGGNEYALMGLNTGTAFVDVTDPANPIYLGRLPSATVASSWRDIKVYQNYAYIVADNVGPHGMQVFDLTRLRGLVGPQTFIADMNYGNFGNAHNLAINESTGFAFAVGTDTCGGGLHMIDITVPINPQFAGCYSATETHDTQCVTYNGLDTDHLGQEICFSSNEDHIEIVNVTLKPAPWAISSEIYPNVGFTHQGWLTEDHRFFFVGDELDEINLGISTRTHVFDVTDLDTPNHVFVYTGSTTSIDHNMYVLGNAVFQANYTSGLRILEFGDPNAGDIQEQRFFDTYPVNDGTSFSGAWSVYPYLPSGTLLVSDINNGLFILSMD